MTTTAPRPLICVSANARQPDDRRRLPMYATAERYVQSLLKNGGLHPRPDAARGRAVDAAELVSCMDGFLLTGGLANIEPHHYEGPPFSRRRAHRSGSRRARPALVAGLHRRARAGVRHLPRHPGDHVAFGGSLHYRIHQLPGKNDHRMPRREDVTREEIYQLKHA